MEARTVRQHTVPPMNYYRETEEEFTDMDKELYTPEEAYELTMKDVKAIYDEQNAV